MRRLLTLAVLLLFALPFGLSVAGCSKKVAVTYCDGNDSGPVVGQLTSLTLNPRLTGISLNEGQIGALTSPTGTDCKGTSVGITSFDYGSSDITLLDIQPTTGRICGGIWNRNSGGGILDYTVCTSNGRQGEAFVTASAQGVTSNAIPVFIHPVVTSIVLGGPTVGNCTTDPSSECYDFTQTNSCLTVPPVVTPYTGGTCLSQGVSQRLVARTYAGTQNISCLVGPLAFTAQTPSVVTIDNVGNALAAQPGATLINAATSNASSTIGSFATCPPASIVLSPSGTTTAPTAPLPGSQNVQQSFITTVKDTNGNPITNITLEYESTTPQTVPITGGVVTPTFPGSAAVTAICQPPGCNPSPINQIGLNGNGLTVTSNPVVINATGNNSSTVLYAGSTNSLYIQPFDFTATTQAASIRLPFAPNSMVISENGTTIYMGSSTELMIFSTSNNSLTGQVTALTGNVIALSPDNNTLVFTDPLRKLIYLYLPGSSAIETQYGGIATHAQFSPDSQTVYITTTDGRMLVYSLFTGWTAVPLANVASDVAVTVPNAGVYLASGASANTLPAPISGRTDCPIVSVNPAGTGGIVTTSDTFYPPADTSSVLIDDRLAATNDGAHILGASTTLVNDLRVAPKTGSCPVSFTSSTAASLPITVAVPSLITGVLPTTDSLYAFVTYQGTGAVVPQYTPGNTTLVNVPLKTVTGQPAPIAPVAGVISADNKTLFVGTTGDNLIHLLTLATGATNFTDTLAPLTPALPSLTTGAAVPNLLVQRPRTTGN